MLRFLLPLAVMFAGLQQVAAQETKLVSLEPISHPGWFVAHNNFVGTIEPSSFGFDPADGTFRMVAGLAGGTSISFESINYPGHYLRHSGFSFYLNAYENTEIFRADASFVEGPSFARGNEASSFHSVNFPDRYLTVEDSLLVLRPFENSTDFMSRISFYVLPGIHNPDFDPYGPGITYGPGKNN